MSSENQLYLWWSGMSNSVFLYFLTGAMAISFLTSILITRSLRRMESRVIALLHDDNGRDHFMTYLLKVSTSVMPGSGCPKSSKVFLQLKQDDKNYEFYQLKSTCCGRVVFQRGHTDIFIIKVPNRIKHMQSVELLVSGLNADLTWKINNVQMYNPVTRENRLVPVKISSLEVLDINFYSIANVNTISLRSWVMRNLLKYHQWFASFGNTVRIGAFTEIIHVLCVFVTFFGLLITSQIFYITLPRGDYIPDVDDDDNDEIDGLFNINIQSLLLSSIISSFCCSVLVLGIELMLRNVRSWEKNPGNAYFTLCNDDSVKFRPAVKLDSYAFPYYPDCYFLPHCDVCDKSSNILTDDNDDDDKNMKPLPQYLEYFIPFIKSKYQTYIQEKNKMNEDFSLKDNNLDSYHDDSPGSSNTGTTTTTNSSDGKHSGQSLHEIQFYSAINLDRLMSTTSIDQQESNTWSYLDQSRVSRTTHQFGNIENDADLDQVIIDVPDYDDPDLNIVLGDNDLGFLFDEDTTQGTVSNDSDSSDRNLNKTKNALVNQEEISRGFQNGRTSVSSHSEQNKAKLKRTISRAWNDECVLSIPTSSDNTRNDDLEILLKNWSRELVKDICDIIKSIREMIHEDKLDIGEITLMLLNKSQDVLQQLLMACYMQHNTEFYDILGTEETCKILTHLSMEIMMTSLIEIFIMLMKRENVNLIDLIIRSHNIMHMIQYTSQLVLYVLRHQQNILTFLRSLVLANDMHQLMTVTLYGCFDLVTKYNLVSWQSIEVLVEKDVKPHLEINCYQDMVQYINDKVDADKMEDSIVTRLCKTAEETAKQEVLEEILNEKMFFANILIKDEAIKTLKSKVSKLKKQKYKIDMDNDLIPKQPKCRIEILVEKRRQRVDNDPDDVHGILKQSAKLSSHTNMRTNDKKVKLQKLEEQSKQMGLYIDNLSTIRERLKKLMNLQGISKKLNGSLLLAQSSLQRLVMIHEGGDTREIKVRDEMFTFENFLQFKRMETTLADYFQAIANELIQFLLTSVGSQYKLSCLSEVDIQEIVFDILVKLDTVVEIFYEDIDNAMMRCIKTEQHLDRLSKLESITSEAKYSAACLIGKSSMMKWSTVDLSGVTSSNMSAVIREDVDGFYKLSEYLDDRVKKPHDNVSGNAVNNEHMTVDDITEDVIIDKNDTTDKSYIDGKNKMLETPNYIKHIIKDLQPVKRILELLKLEEDVRSEVTMVRYYKKCQEEREVICRSQLNHIIDRYHVLNEGEELLTSSGLYQLEHDCMYEDTKTLPPIVKTFTVAFIVLFLILIIVYVTMIGGQFSITDLQEWVCYYMFSIVIFGFLVEPFRACVVGLYMDTFEEKLHRNVSSRSKPTVHC